MQTLDSPARTFLSLLVAATLAASCRAPAPPPRGPSPALDRQEVEAVLDRFHHAAAEADGDTYFAQMDPNGVFLGTDATEHWDVAAFAAYARPYFDAGRGWDYRPLERHVYFGQARDTAWFDERLWNEKYGECRGTGVLRRHADGWKIVHYSLTFVVPNEVSKRVVEVIRAGEADGE